MEFGYLDMLVTFAVALVVAIVSVKLLIPFLQKKQLKQFQREEGPKSHMVKEGTPSMGGLGIIFAIIVATLIGASINAIVIAMIIVMIAFGAIGFLDDYSKAVKKQNEGLTPIQKIILQIVLSVGFAIYMGYFSGVGTCVWIPFINEYVDFGIWYVPFVAFILIAMTNSVNLTDGMDGLASGTTAIVSAAFVFIGVLINFQSPTVFLIAICGACLGFLVFNKYPAKVFMGDTGSMALGAALSVGVIVLRVELLLPIAGLVYVAEALSVILQVVYFKKTGGKRLFKMAPLHHHFEEGGMKETRVVAMFWLATLACCFIALAIVYI